MRLLQDQLLLLERRGRANAVALPLLCWTASHHLRCIQPCVYQPRRDARGAADDMWQTTCGSLVVVILNRCAPTSSANSAPRASRPEDAAGEKAQLFGARDTLPLGLFKKLCGLAARFYHVWNGLLEKRVPRWVRVIAAGPQGSW